MGFGRACAPVRCAHPSFWAHCHAHRGASRPTCPSQLRCSPQNKRINYFQKQKVFLQAQTRAARGVYFSTGLSCTRLSYAAPYWAKLHPNELRCTLLSCFAPYLSYAAIRTMLLHLDKRYPSELRYSLLSYATYFWATLHPTELRRTLNELCGTLKYNVSCHRSWADPISDIIDIVYRENPAKCPSSGNNPSKFATAYVVYATVGGTVNLYVSQVMLK